MITQIELEQRASEDGLRKLLADASKSEAEGRASGTFYAKQILEKYIHRAALIIQEERDTPKAGRGAAHATLVEPFKPEMMAFIAVSQTLNYTMTFEDDSNAVVGKLRRNIGTALYNEYFMRAFAHAKPELFYTISKDLSRRQSKSARHEVTVMKMQAKKNDVEFVYWSAQNIEQVGSYCVDLLIKVGMIEVKTFQVSKMKRKTIVMLTDEALELVVNTKKIVSYFRPQRFPFVEKPRDWEGLTNGGYYTQRMQNTFPRCVKASPTQMELLKQADMSKVVSCLNALQATEWAVNKKVLEVQRQLFKPYREAVKPLEIDCHTKDKEDWTEADKVEHKLWKRQMAQWYTENKLSKFSTARDAATISMAREFSEYDKFYFMYFADWRMRYYPVTSGLSPQGPDNQKGLLKFAEGLPLNDNNAVKWFLLHGTGKYGFDKVSVDERIQWVHENHRLLMAVANDPLDTSSEWMQADKPYQFLAWCFEYAEWKNNPSTFISHLPISMDGSCNGLQNYSGLLLDEVGGAATNLLPSDQPNDIYQQVANETLALLQGKYYNEEFTQQWLQHGVSRKCVKRCVMTLPYGAKKFSFGRFILNDYLQVVIPDEFEKDDYPQAASFLGNIVWEAIGKVVVKAIEAMSYLQGLARAITAREGCEYIHWTAPSGAPIVQAYFKGEYVEFKAKQNGNTKLRVLLENDDLNKLAHADGIAPNIIHSFDASHLTFTVIAAKASRIDSLAMIHDDYATHAANTEKLSELIRGCFSTMYKQPVFNQLADELEAQAKRTYAKVGPTLPPYGRRPEFGNLDIDAVLNSKYFFI